MSGGQSAIASLATENADAQSRQNAATMTGKGSRTRSDDKGIAGGGTVMSAVRMAIFLSGLQIGLRIAILKLNDRIISSRNINRYYDA
jgi:hypothetical protein